MQFIEVFKLKFFLIPKIIKVFYPRYPPVTVAYNITAIHLQFTVRYAYSVIHLNDYTCFENCV